mgnify:CR=1 FL=1
MTSHYTRIAERLMRIPTAPFREHWMCAAIDRMVACLPGVELSCDGFGNRIARLRRGNPSGPPVVFVAHLDHPGFLFPTEAGIAQGAGGRFEATFEGRVETRYFAGSRARFFRSPDDPGVAARVTSTSDDLPESGNRLVVLEAGESIDGATLGMWDVEPFRVDATGLVYSRACDDLAGCAAMLEALRRLAESAAPDLDFSLVFSRAEEAGFCGLLCRLDDPGFEEHLSPDSLFLSVETSGEVGEARVGSGAIIRVGDRSTTFDGGIVDLLWGLASGSSLRARRALMDRGTCEATAFARAGLRAGGVCIPVRNYHNQDPATGRIAPECVSLADAEALVELIRGLGEACGQGDQPRAVVAHDYGRYLKKGLGGLCPVPLGTQLI